MKIEKDKVVSIDYTLTDGENEVIDSSKGGAPLAYLHGNGNLVPGLEKALEGKTTGESVKVSIPPEEGYGLRNEERVGEVPRSAFAGAPDVQPGMQFQARGPHGVELVTVVAVGNDTVTVDGNHPLAGETLNFDVTVRDVRDATAEELEHGHAHAPGGHHH
ncbi:FKBP-type peptidyl-prolyl cis-trans isomerase [Verrucomicrobiota bacterium sgz303538]